MNSIFTDKKLLNQEYKRLFLEYLSDLSKIKQCICSRYDKKIISDKILKNLFTNNHKIIFDFIGKNNENRITYFFGNSQEDDIRDKQIRIIDRLILDSIHFEIMISLITRLEKEYVANKMIIDKHWDAEIQDYNKHGPIESIFILQRILNLNKNNYFADLEFPKQPSLSLFSLNETRVTPNAQVFKNWIPQTKPKQNVLSYLIPVLIFTLLFSVFIYGTVVGSLGISISMVILMIIVGVCANSFVVDYSDKINDDTIINSTTEKNCSLSHSLMVNKMPSNLEVCGSIQPEPIVKQLRPLERQQLLVESDTNEKNLRPAN